MDVSRLAGMLPGRGLGTPKQPAAVAALERLLTPSVARLLREPKPGKLLQAVNGELETPSE